MKGHQLYIHTYIHTYIKDISLKIGLNCLNVSLHSSQSLSSWHYESVLVHDGYTLLITHSTEEAISSSLDAVKMNSASVWILS